MMENLPPFLSASSSSTPGAYKSSTHQFHGNHHRRRPELQFSDMGFGAGDMSVRNVDVDDVVYVSADKEMEKTEEEGEFKKEKKKKGRGQRFAFQTRSQLDILDDGYRWRKYGQKAVKNNKFPRSYYRCTHEGCRVKKQVQRLTRDEGVVVTTYEGIHSHPIHKATDNFEHILTQMQIYPSFS